MSENHLDKGLNIESLDQSTPRTPEEESEKDEISEEDTIEESDEETEDGSISDSEGINTSSEKSENELEDSEKDENYGFCLSIDNKPKFYFKSQATARSFMNRLAKNIKNNYSEEGRVVFLEKLCWGIEIKTEEKFLGIFPFYTYTYILKKLRLDYINEVTNTEKYFEK